MCDECGFDECQCYEIMRDMDWACMNGCCACCGCTCYMYDEEDEDENENES